MELSNKQKEIVFSKEKNILVEANASSGKTTCLTERAKYLLSHGANPHKIALMTFTNAAAEEMSKRIGVHEGMYIGTIHGYANQLLLRYGIDTEDIISNESYDELFERVFKNPKCAKEIDYLLVDEAQDLTEDEFIFIFDIIKPKSFFIVGDARQSIYQFRSARPDLFLSIEDREDTVTYNLNENYRNGSEILNFAKRIIDKVGIRYIDKSIPMRKISGTVIEEDYDLELIYNLIKNNDWRINYKDWFILCRYNADVDIIYNYLTENEIPCTTFKKSDFNSLEMDMMLKTNTVKVLTIHTAKGLEADNVIVIGAKFFSDEEKRISYVAATRARNKLFWIKKKKEKKTKTSVWE